MTEQYEDSDARPPEKVRDALSDPDNVTGAEFAPPFDLDGYLDEPVLRFGLWVGDNTEDAELVTFEVRGAQIHALATAFKRASDDVADIYSDDPDDIFDEDA